MIFNKMCVIDITVSLAYVPFSCCHGPLVQSVRRGGSSWVSPRVVSDVSTSQSEAVVTHT